MHFGTIKNIRGHMARIDAIMLVVGVVNQPREGLMLPLDGLAFRLPLVKPEKIL